MEFKSLKSAALAIVPAFATFALLQACGGSDDAFAQTATATAAADPIEGVWEAIVTRRDCASGASLGTFRGVNVFHRGGTLSDTNGAPTSTRGPGFGLWSKTAAGYTAAFRFYRYNPDGSLAGSTRVSQTLTMAADGNSTEATISTQLLDLGGAVVQTQCVTAASTRFS